MNTTCDISRLSQISLAKRLVKLRITISKYHLWYLCQILLQIMPLPIPTIYNINIAVGIVFLNWEGQILNAFRMTGKNFPEVLKNSSVEIGCLTVF